MHFESLATIRFPFYLLFLFTAWNASSMTLSNVLELLLLRKKTCLLFCLFSLVFLKEGFFWGKENQSFLFTLIQTVQSV